MNGAQPHGYESTFGEVSSYIARLSGSPLYSESYVRDNLGRITQRTEVLQGVTTVWGYGYDLSGRLVTVTRNGAAFESYTFDSNDNRLTKTTTAGTTTYAHDDQDRLLSAVGPGGAESWVYDGHGDLLSHNGSAGQTSFDYETGGQLLSLTRPDGDVVSYEMDAANKRAVKRVNGVVQRQWVYAGGLLPVAELDGSGNLVAVFNGGFMVKNGTTYRLLRDHLGSVRMVVDASTGTVVQRLSYDAWGNVLEDTNPGFQPFGYAGGLYDPDTGLVRFGARDLDPSTSRWTCKDPSGLEAGVNLYAYCFGEPINFTDDEGLKPNRRGRRGTMSYRRLGARMVAQSQWREWFGSESFDIHGMNLTSGASYLYRHGFRYAGNERGTTPCPSDRFFVFKRRLSDGRTVIVKYDEGNKAKGEKAHWKIYVGRGDGGPYQYFNYRGDPVDFNESAAHMRAGERGWQHGKFMMPPIYPEGTTLMHGPVNNSPRMELRPVYDEVNH